MAAHRTALAGFMMAMLLLAGGATAQPMSDCSQAKTSIEKAICGDKTLADADQAMARAYAGLRSTLPAPQQTALLADQRRWVRLRHARCADNAERELAACLLAETEARRRFLAGDEAAGSPATAGLRPAFFQEAKAGRYEISIAYPQFAAPADLAQNAFNRMARAVPLGKDAVAEYRAMAPPMAKGAHNYYEVDYAVPYLDRRLASVVFTISTFTGGAHPNMARQSLVFDLAKGRALRLADLLAEPKAAVAAIAAQCKAQLQAEARKEGWELFDNADVAATVGNMKYWAPDKDGVAILFDPYSVAAYVVGARQCRLSYADLRPWLKPGGPLPPQQ